MRSRRDIIRISCLLLILGLVPCKPSLGESVKSGIQHIRESATPMASNKN